MAELNYKWVLNNGWDYVDPDRLEPVQLGPRTLYLIEWGEVTDQRFPPAQRAAQAGIAPAQNRGNAAETAVERRISRTVWTGGGLTADHTLRYIWDGDRVIQEWLVAGSAGGPPGALDLAGRGVLVAEDIWGAPAPNSLLAQRRTSDFPRALANGQASGHFDLSSLPKIENGLWVHPVLDRRGNLRTVVAASENVDGSGVVLFTDCVEEFPLSLGPDLGPSWAFGCGRNLGYSVWFCAVQTWTTQGLGAPWWAFQGGGGPRMMMGTDARMLPC